MKLDHWTLRFLVGTVVLLAFAFAYSAWGHWGPIH